MLNLSPAYTLWLPRILRAWEVPSQKEGKCPHLFLTVHWLLLPQTSMHPLDGPFGIYLSQVSFEHLPCSGHDVEQLKCIISLNLLGKTLIQVIIHVLQRFTCQEVVQLGFRHRSVLFLNVLPV